MYGTHCLKSWSKTLSVVALSSGEAELGALIRGATEGLGLISVLRDLGFQCELMLRSDASAAIGIVQRLGLGRVRHLTVSDLWLQQRLRKGDFKCEKVPGEDNSLVGRLFFINHLIEIKLMLGKFSQPATHENGGDHGDEYENRK